jgi:threonine dehydrogenase-like Zn-dependent dehydrogenase
MAEMPSSRDYKMRAAVAYPSATEFVLQEFDVPRLEAGDVLVRVEAVGVTRGLLSMWYFTDMIKLFPAVLGHGIAGVVDRMGRSVNNVQEGDRVRVHTLLTCGNCDDCRNDRESLCHFQCTIGASLYEDAAMPLYKRYHHGGMAQYVKVPSASLQQIPDNVTYDVAAHVGTLAGSFRALRLAMLEFGDNLVVTAASGASGAAAVRCASLFGLNVICGVSTNRSGLERLKGSNDLTHIIATADLPEEWEQKKLLTSAIVEATGNEGPDAIIDCMPSGRHVTMQAIRSMKPGGRAILSGGNISELNVSYLEIMRNQYQLKGIRGTIRRDEREIMKLLAAERLRVSDLITHAFPLAEANRAVKTVVMRRDNPVFVVLKPWA